MAGQVVIPEELHQFIKEYADDYYSVFLLLFFAAHPRARFNKLAITHALDRDNGGHYVHQALGKLVDKGVIDMRMDNNIPLYLLCDNTSIRSPVLQLGKLGMRQRQGLLKQVCPHPVKKEYRIAWYSAGRQPSAVSTMAVKAS